MWATGISSNAAAPARPRPARCQRLPGKRLPGKRLPGKPLAAGFTLLEVLVVMSIVAVVSGLALIGWPSGLLAGGEQRDLERLRAQIGLAGDASAMSGRPVGLILTPGGYRFVEYRGAERWAEVSMEALQGFSLLAGRAALLIDGRPVALSDRAIVDQLGADRFGADAFGADSFGADRSAFPRDGTGGVAATGNAGVRGHSAAERALPAIWTDAFGEWPAFEIRLIRPAGSVAVLRAVDGELLLDAGVRRRSRVRVPRTAGFTLLEVLVALAVVAIALGAVVSAAGQGARSAATLQDKLLATWVAENRLAEVTLAGVPGELGEVRGEAQLGGRRWYWRQRAANTEVNEVVSVRVAVFETASGLAGGPGLASGSPIQADPLSGRSASPALGAAGPAPLVELVTLLVRDL